MLKPLVEHPYIMTEASRSLISYLQNISTTFETRLFDLIFVSDSINLEKLKKVYPGEVNAVDSWRNDPDYADWLRSKA